MLMGPEEKRMLQMLLTGRISWTLFSLPPNIRVIQVTVIQIRVNYYIRDIMLRQAEQVSTKFYL